MNEIENFYQLSPTDSIEHGKAYFDALDWALDNRKGKNIKNIALTGIHGSGKSSILRSYQKYCENKKLEFLNISLAKFNEKNEINEEKKKEDKVESENLQRLIELSILQQLFYREKNKDLPDSRLRKITSFSKGRLSILTLRNFLFIISFIFLFIFLYKPNLITYIFPKIPISESINYIMHYIALFGVFLCILFISFKLIRTLYNLKINKLNINKAEIHIDSNINKSVLNHNLEEILYFFEVTNYNVVILEDLDRFQKTEIFTKLREINLMINNSKKIKKDVIFIYALHDIMFVDKEKIKFFDFIIPVIPIIHHSNSYEILQKNIKNIVSIELIKIISMFIDEMRLLNNIVNEFNIYNNILFPKAKLPQYKESESYQEKEYRSFKDKLLTMIIKLFKTIEYKLSQDNKSESPQYEESKSYQDKKHKSHQDKLFAMIVYKNIYSDDFAKLNQDKGILYNILRSDIIKYIKQKTDEISKMEEEINKLETLEQKEQQKIDDIQELKRKISSLESEIKEKIDKIFYDENISIEESDHKSKLIYLLLLKCYIDENYLDYISLFHEGSLSRNDKDFLLNVKIKCSSNLDHHLDNIENVINEIEINDFGKEYILNYSLFEFILSDDKYEKQKKAVCQLLQNKSDNILEFIYDYICNDGNKIGLRINKLYNNKICIFDHIYNSNIPDEEKKLYFELIINNADIKDISTMPKSILPKIIADNPNGNYNIFKFSNNNKMDISKIKEVLDVLDIKFNYEIDPTIIFHYDKREDMFDYIYKNNHYAIKIDLLKIIIEENGTLKEFDNQNYYAIKESGCENLIKYIDSEINEYIKNVYLELEENTKESEEYLIKLLNNEGLIIENKTKIIQKVETKISSLKEINAVEIKNLLMQASKVEAEWENLIYYYNNTQEFDTISKFLKNKENNEKLSKSKITDENKPDEKTIIGFIEELISKKDLNKDLYHSLFKRLDLDNRYLILLLESSNLEPKDKQNIINYYEEESIITDKYILNSIAELIKEDDFYNFSKNILKAIFEKSDKSVNDKITIFNKKNNEFDNDEITNFLELLNEPYLEIAKKGIHFLPLNDTNTNFLIILKKKKYIKAFTVEDDKIKISV